MGPKRADPYGTATLRAIQSFWSVVAECKEADKQLLAALTPEHPIAAWEHQIVEPGGEPRWEQWRVRALFDDRGGVLHYQAVGRNITERKQAQAERELLVAQRALAESLRENDRRKDEFLATLAHELRNPLAPIANAVEILRRLPSVDAQVRYARDVIGRQTAHLVRLVDDLLDVARVTSGKIQLRLETLDLATVIAGAVETSRPLIESCKVTLSTDIPSTPLHVRGDAVRLAQLISNLLNNAAKYTPVGGHIGLAAVRDQAQIVLRITDTGAGIPKDMLARVFEPFTQVDRSRDGVLGGLGLGLPLVKRLVEMHGGTVHAQSEGPGLGSAFVVQLPAAPPEASNPRIADRIEPEPPVRAARAHALRVLVVDDVLDAAQSLARVLSLHGCSVHVACDGRTALELAERVAPEVAFVDLGMPEMDGLEVARRLRNRSNSAGILLVAVTGFGQPGDRHRTSEAGFDHHLTKPLDPGAVQALLATVPEPAAIPHRG